MDHTPSIFVVVPHLMRAAVCCRSHNAGWSSMAQHSRRGTLSLLRNGTTAWRRTSLEGLKFRRERPEDHEDNGISIVNSTELRAADVDVRPLVPSGLASSVYQPGTRRQPARSGRRAAVVERAAPPELPANTVYEIRADTDALIRRECW